MPLSRVSGASPASLAISRRLSKPMSGKSASKVQDSTRPTPGTLLSNSSFSCHRGIARSCWSNSELSARSSLRKKTDVTAKLAMKDPWRLLEPVLFCHQHLHQLTAARHQRMQIAGPLVD